MASLAGPITKNAAPVTEALYMGCLKAMRTPTEMSRFDAVINLSCKTVSLPLGGACEAYCSVLVPDVEDEALVLPKLVYATRWVVEQVRLGRRRILVASQYGVNRAAAVCAMFLISHDKVTVPNALRAVQAAMDARGRHGLKPKMRTLANAAMARIVANMVHGNDYGIVHGASFAASSALLIDPPCPPIPLAVKPGPTAHQAAFLKHMLTHINFGTYIIQRQPKPPTPPPSEAENALAWTEEEPSALASTAYDAYAPVTDGTRLDMDRDRRVALALTRHPAGDAGPGTVSRAIGKPEAREPPTPGGTAAGSPARTVSPGPSKPSTSRPGGPTFGRAPAGLRAQLRVSATTSPGATTGAATGGSPAGASAGSSAGGAGAGAGPPATATQKSTPRSALGSARSVQFGGAVEDPMVTETRQLKARLAALQEEVDKAKQAHKGTDALAGPDQFPRSTEVYAPPEVIEWWYPPMWTVARPPAGRALQVPFETINLLLSSTWFVKQGESDAGGALRLHIGAKLDWDVAVFPSFKEGQTVQTARAVVMEWIQAQQDSAAEPDLTKVPVKACLGRMFGRSNALLDAGCQLVRLRNSINTMLGLLGYDVDISDLRTANVEIMRPVVQDLRDIQRRIVWNRAKAMGAV